jgi:farnesyl diphosphate synthase
LISSLPRKTGWIYSSSTFQGTLSSLTLLHFLTIYMHRTIVIYKTAIYSYLPVAFALLICGFPVEKKNESDPDYSKLALDILLPLGEYFQIQDDYLDFAETPEQIGKIGTDILDNKCSRCVNTVLARVTPAQRAILDADYGCKDYKAEARVK